MAIIKTEGITKRYPMGKRKFTALRDIDLKIEKGEFTGIVGPSGSGKTTLLNIIGALDNPSQGSATVLGKKLRHCLIKTLQTYVITDWDSYSRPITCSRFILFMKMLNYLFYY